MSRRNQNNNPYNNYYQYDQYGNSFNMSVYPSHGMYHYEQGEYTNDNNYYTNENFKKRVENSNVFQNGHYSNQNNGGYITYDMQHSNWGYRSSVNNTNQHIGRIKTNGNYNNASCIGNTNQNYNSKPNFTPNFSNNRQFVGNTSLNNKFNQAKTFHKVAAGVNYESVSSTITSENASYFAELERPSTRIISKQSLRENTELSNYVHNQTAPVSFNYTDFWMKGRENVLEKIEETEDPCYVLETRKKAKKNQTKNKSKKNKCPELRKANEFGKKVTKMLTTPVEMNKGRSLLEKMGWTGGGLGKDGDGIVEPIVPDAYYAGATLGLGQLTEEDKEDIVDHVYLRTLKVILKFVKNNLEAELKFDPRLNPMERKRIHRTIQEIGNGEHKFPEPYKSVIMDICQHNEYILYTESDGFQKTRHLTLYKEPHEHMYIIVPDDLNYNEKSIDCKDSNKKKYVRNKHNVQVEEHSMPEGSQESSEIKNEDHVVTKEISNGVENVIITQDKNTVMKVENIICESENETMQKDITIIKETNNMKDDVEVTQESTFIDGTNISQTVNEVMDKDNTFIKKTNNMKDDVEVTQESTFIDGTNISQTENKVIDKDYTFIKETNTMKNDVVVTQDSTFIDGTNISIKKDDDNFIQEINNKITDVIIIQGKSIDEENISKSENELNVEEKNQVHNQEGNPNTIVKKENQANVPDSKLIENINNQNNSEVKPGMIKLSKKQKRRLRAEQKIKHNKFKNDNAKYVIHIEKKENNRNEVFEILDTIVKYFIEYTKDPLVTEFRFLGPFDYKERCAIGMFFGVCKGIQTIDRSQEVLDLFNCDDFYQEIRQDSNGGDMILKISKKKEHEI